MTGLRSARAISCARAGVSWMTRTGRGLPWRTLPLCHFATLPLLLCHLPLCHLLFPLQVVRASLGHHPRRPQQALERAGVRPPAFEDLPGQVAALQVGVVHIGDLELAPPA